MKLDVLKTVNAERAARRAVFVVTDVGSGAQRVVKAADIAAQSRRHQQRELCTTKLGQEF